MANDKIRREPDDLDFDDEFMEDDGGGVAELSEGEDDEDLDDE